MTRVERIAVLIVGIALLAICTFADLSIATTLYTRNAFGRALEVVGELPFAFLAVFARALLFRFRARKTHEGTLVPEESALSPLGCDEHIAMSRICADGAITLVKDVPGLLPLSPQRMRRVDLNVLAFRGVSPVDASCGRADTMY